MTNPLSIPAIFLKADGQRLSLAAYGFLIFLSFAFFAPGIVSMPPTDRDESLYAQATKQMIETGNYIDIRYLDQPRYKKPIGIYWAQAAAAKLFNPDDLNEIWVYRIPSLVGATLAVLLTAAIGATLFNPATGFLAALMLASCLLLNVEARLAKTDAALLASTLTMLLGLASAYKGQKLFRDFFLFWAGLGASLLIKGPMALLILLGILLWLRISEKNLSWFRNLRPMMGVPLLLLMTMPWFVTILLQSKGTFIHESAGQDLLQKIWHGQGGMRPPGMHVLVFPLLFFPASLLALLAIPDTWRNRANPALRFCLGWIIPFWIVFELPLTKLPHYVLPTYPAIALLTAKALLDGYPALRNPEAERPAVWPVLSVLLWMLIGMALAIAVLWLPKSMGAHEFDLVQGLAGLTLLIAMGITLPLLLRQPSKAVPTLVVGSLVFFGAIFGRTLPTMPHLWVSQDVVQQAALTPVPCEQKIMTTGFSEPSLAFLGGSSTRFFNSAEVLAQNVASTPCALAVVHKDRNDDFKKSLALQKTTVHPIGEVTGYNMGAGRTVTLYLYTNN